MNPLVGRYKLKSHGIYELDGTFVSTSSYINGELMYGSDGALSVLILFKKLPETAKDVYGYLGTYRIVSASVVEHQFTVATAPAQVNAVEERTFKIEQDELRLGRDLGERGRFEAVWVRYR